VPTVYIYSKPVIDTWLQNYGSKRTSMPNKTIIAKETETTTTAKDDMKH